MRPPIKSKNKKALILLSGGLDSTTTLFLAKSKGYLLSSLIFDYGQRHKKEIDCARRLAKAAGSKYRIIKLSLSAIGSSLLNKEKDIPNSRRRRSGIPSTYVAARNLIFLSIAVSFAENEGAGAIFIGANSVDFSGYPDCRPQFYKKFREVISVGTKSGVGGRPIKILTPLISKSKKEIVILGQKLCVPYQLTWSCYKGASRPCGVCESCSLRRKGFQEAGMEDPLSVDKR